MKELKSNEVKIIKQQDKALVDFYATWCGPCMYMKPYFEEAEKEIKNYGIECYEIDVDECEEFSFENKIQFVPCVIYFEKGKEIARFTGGKDKEGIMDFVRKNAGI